MKIISTKLNPKDILPILQIIRNYQDIVVIKKHIHDYLESVSVTGSISMRNAVYALALPTLRQLNLITGRGKYVQLDVDGNLLLETFEKDGSEAYMRLLAKIILRADRENANVLGILRKSKKNRFTKKEIVRELSKHNIETSERDDRLVKWLRTLKYVGLIDRSNEHYRLNNYQINALQKDTNVSSEAFSASLIKSYEKIVSKRRGNPYIPIPVLEREVCSLLSDEGFTTFDFRKRLVDMKNKKMDNYRIFFSKPGAREAKGLRIDGKYYYYVALFRE